MIQNLYQKIGNSEKLIIKLNTKKSDLQSSLIKLKSQIKNIKKIEKSNFQKISNLNKELNDIK